MAYIAAADFRERTVKPYCANLILSETDGLDPYIDLVIAQVTTQVELDLADDFEPAPGDADEAIDVDGWNSSRLYSPRRIRALTTVQTRLSWLTTYVTESSTSYRIKKSLNAAGTAMIDGSTSDWLDALAGLSTGVWPMGAGTVKLTGKFGWAAVPDDIKRLVALKTYDLIKGSADPLSRIVQRQTLDATITFGPSPEIDAITARYQRTPALAYIG